MNTSDIWISIIMPLLLGPLFVFLKTIYDSYKNNKNERKMIVFKEDTTTIKTQLEQFYWPIYLKLLCIYQLNYSIPNEETDYICDGYSSSSSNSTIISESSEDDNTNNSSGNLLHGRHKCKKYKKNRCAGFYTKENKEIYKCNNTIPKNGISRICKICRWKMVKEDIVINILDDSIEDEEENSGKNLLLRSGHKNKKSSFKRHRNRRKRSNRIVKDSVEINIPNMGEFEDIDLELDSDNKLSNKLQFLKISIDSDTIKILKKHINHYYKDCVNLIESNIYIARPDNKLGLHLIQFIKYCRIRSVVNEGTFDQKYSVEHFGAKNNTNKLLTHIEAHLFRLSDKFNNLMEKGPY